MTKQEWADNARALANFIKAESRKYNNISTFDFFDLLTDGKGKNRNMLKREYCNFIRFDSHPNIRANREVGRDFVNLITQY